MEAEEFRIGGQPSGKRGRVADHKCAVAISFERKGRKLGWLRLQVIKDCLSGELIPFVPANIERESIVTADGWPGYPIHDTWGRVDIGNFPISPPYSAQS